MVQNTFLVKIFCLHFLAVKRELEAEAAALAEKEKAAAAEVCACSYRNISDGAPLTFFLLDDTFKNFD